MPGARYLSFRCGDIAESFAGTLLKRIAFVTQVPREEDIGHDFICTISEKDGKFVKAGPTFTIQVKSNNKPIIYKKKHELSWITNQENPFFIVISENNSDSLKIYTTYNILNAILEKSYNKIRLIPGEPKNKKGLIQWIGKGPCIDIYLGKPVLEIASSDLNDNINVNKYTEILRQWVLLDRENIVRRASKMYCTLNPTSYKTNEPIKDSQYEHRFYYNAKNFNHCFDNLFRSIVAWLLVVKKCKLDNDWQSFHDDLSLLLKKYCNILYRSPLVDISC